ncbi:two-component regulator propeller domain-containing protein [Reichenbachiella ulvae]|uniref:histidine kinase n=1 Tax=Reichenbachiella ulvae TaxID=2980104 RepID=A0ABT3CSH2_9BACT|nr:two-component regulator propeller domain-containing protein [Reichenbachiella ulvae]MCV9386513.1 ATP-binding protein [Reichenbachiella ulvae]
MKGKKHVISRKTASYRFLLHLVFCFASFSVGGQNIDYQNLSIREGLSHNSVFSVLQDNYGYIWLGTSNSLHRFDGYEFRTYQNERERKDGISQGAVRTLFQDSEERIWIGTESGLSYFYRGEIVPFNELNNQMAVQPYAIEEMLETPSGELWIATWGGGIFVWDEKELKAINKSTAPTLETDIIVDFLWDESRRCIWIGTWDGGLYRYMVESQSMEKVTAFPGINARALALREASELWVGTWGDGLYVYRDDVFEQHLVEAKGAIAIFSNKILDLAVDHKDQLWVGTFGGGVHLYDGENFLSYANDPQDNNSLCGNYVETITIDDEGALWVGTKGAGVSRMKPTPFHAYPYLKKKSYDPFDPTIPGVVKDERGNKWVLGPERKLVQLTGKEYKMLAQLYEQEYRESYMFIVLRDLDGKIWCGGETGSGLFVIDNEQFIDFNQKGRDFRRNNINDIYQDSQGRVWLSMTYDGGLYCFDGDEEIYYRNDPRDSSSISSTEILYVTEDHEGVIWVATWRGGLIRYDFQEFKTFRESEGDSGINSNLTLSTFESRSNQLYVVTETGLNLLDRETMTFEHFGKEEGLQTNLALGVVEDEKGKLWLSTLTGVTVFDPEARTFTNYKIRSGLSDDIHNRIGHSNEDYYLVGTQGFVRFDPVEVQEQIDNTHQLYITGLYLGDEVIHHLDGKSVESLDEITISRQKDRSLGFEFSILNYDLDQKRMYAYRMGKRTDDWVNLGDNNFVYLSRLRPGKYQFQVRSSLDGVHWDVGKVLSIWVKPKWYEQSWFIGLVMIALVILIMLLIRSRNVYLERQKDKLEKLVDKKTRQLKKKNKLLKSKTQMLELRNNEVEKFAYVASHDLKSPLHTIEGMMDILRDNLNGHIDPESERFMGYVKETTQRMVQLINGLLEHARIGTDHKFETVDLNQVLKHLRNDLGRNIEESCTELKIGEMPVLNGQELGLRLLFQNLISNAIKFRPAHRSPVIEISCLSSPASKEKYYKFMVRDNGIGIPERYQKQIFGIFKRLHNTNDYEGTGIGLAHCKKVVDIHRGELWVESVPDEGSTFYFTISSGL